ncbi:uncharacterized protein LOC122527247 [Frieseomelitta varia]|uniref:uncharacterized protein LOC122527247 n=1 Tax=Frieseomelitta varia TaxID=561572 RepID=UPI001CB6984B|nr:uncharacterized protein LOC122527247 [Frieseomelitta varia]
MYEKQGKQIFHYLFPTFRVKCARIEFKLVKDHSANGEIRNTLPAILEIIDIFHDRFLSGKHGGKKHTSSVKKKLLSRSSQEITFYPACCMVSPTCLDQERSSRDHGSPFPRRMK